MVIRSNSLDKTVLRFAVLSLQMFIIGFSSSAVSAPFPLFPIEPNNPNREHKGAGRFGEARGNDELAFGKYGHQGVDITENNKTDLYAVADSVIVGKGFVGTGAGNGVVLKPINGPDVIVAYYHLHSFHKNLPGVGKTIKAGTPIGYVGGTKVAGTSEAVLGPHLHIGIGVRKRNEAVAVTLNNHYKYKNKEAIYRQGLGGTASASSRFGGTYYWTNPAPYLNRDVIIKLTGNQYDPLIPYIGNSIRTQYNALTGSNLTPSSRATLPNPNFKIPKLLIANNGVPSSVETEMAQSRVLSILTSENAGELVGQDTISPEQFAYYAPPRTIFSGDNNSVNIDVGDGDISHSQMIDKIGSQRFGNQEWQKELIGISMRGMLSEYLNMINAKNFIKKEQLKQRERVEALYAAWTTQAVKQTLGKQLNQSVEKAVSAVEIPTINSTPIEELFERIENGGAATNLEFATAVSTFEPGKHPKNCLPAYFNKFERNIPFAKKKELLALALRLGFHPNDLANVVGFETSFDPEAELYRSRNSSGSIKAAGLIQLTPGGAAGIPYKTIDRLLPSAGSIIKKHLGATFNYNRPHGDYLRELGNANPRWEFSVYDAYFYSKNKSFFNTPASQKNIIKLYTQVFGGPQKKYNRDGSLNPGYAQNAGLDKDGDGTVSAYEAVMFHKRFQQTRCNYYPDDHILQNKYGLTNDDLKYIPWDNGVKKAIVNSPTLSNLGGHFSTGLTLKEMNRNGQ